ncbi:MAG: AMP-binding protein, partial [Steroidobacteraceae bacterium]
MARLLHDSLLHRDGSGTQRGRIALLVDGQPYSYGQLADASRRLAWTFQSLGVRRGDRVALFLDNSWPCVVSIYATFITGAAIVLINPQTKEEKLEFILRDSSPRVLVSADYLAHVFSTSVNRLDSALAIICSGSPSRDAGIHNFECAIASDRPLAQEAASIPLVLAAILYT